MIGLILGNKGIDCKLYGKRLYSLQLSQIRGLQMQFVQTKDRQAQLERNSQRVAEWISEVSTDDIQNKINGNRFHLDL